MPRLRHVASLLVLTLPACAVKLAERNEPALNGAVTGAALDCSTAQPLPRGAPGGAAEPKFLGRFLYLPAEPPDPANPKTPVFDWSGNSITAAFEGTDRITVKIDLLGVPQPGKDYELVQDQMFEFVLDGVPSTKQITVQTGPDGKPTLIPLENYEIGGLTPGPHEIIVYKNTEAQKGAVQFKGFDLHGGRYLPPVRRARKIEFIGDSIICGYGNLGTNATCPFEVSVRKVFDPTGAPIVGADGRQLEVTVPITENQYLSFTSQAARALDADATTICWSGKGVYKNYKERYVADPENTDGDGDGKRLEDDATTTVPMLWAERTLATDFEGARKSLAEGGTRYDFAAETAEDKPQVVFVSLGTNDFSRDAEPKGNAGQLGGNNIPDGDLGRPEEINAFYGEYLKFVVAIRAARPDAHIFLATPPMVTDQFPLENARRNLQQVLNQIVQQRASEGDTKVYKMDLVEQGFRYGLGCDYHPNMEVHRIMAEQVIGAIRSKTCW